MSPTNFGDFPNIFLSFHDLKLFIVWQPLGQLTYKSFYNLSQVLFYFWQIRVVLKHSKLPKYYITVVLEIYF